MSDRPAPKSIVPLSKPQQELAARWVPLARKTAKKYGQDFDVCLEALCKAARGYKPERGYTFQALAQRCMSNACIDEIRKKRVELVEFDETFSWHLGTSNILGEVEGAPEAPPMRAWKPPADLPERKPRPAGTSARSAQRRAKERGEARPAHRPSVLTDRVLAAVLAARPGITTAQLADALGVSRRTIERYDKSRQGLRRIRRDGLLRTFGSEGHQSPPEGPSPGAAPPPRWL